MGMGMVVEEEGMVVVVEEEEEERLGMEEGLRQEEMKLGRGEVEASERYHTHKFTKLHSTRRQETPLHKRHTLFCRAYKLLKFTKIKQKQRPPSQYCPSLSFQIDSHQSFSPKTSPPFLGSRNTPSPKRGRQTFPKPPPSSASPNLSSLD